MNSVIKRKHIFNYDPSGNLTSDTGNPTSVANTWNYRNELMTTAIASSGNQTSVSYGYDSSGQRVSLVETSAGGVTNTRFPTPSYSETVRPDNSVERTVSIEVAGIPVATVRTVDSGTPEVFADHTDHLGSTRLATDVTGAVAEKTDYDPFGKIVSHIQTGDFTERKKFTSHEFDTSTGYTYAKARYLDTGVGRFVSQDPVFLAIGDSQLGASKIGNLFTGDVIENRLKGQGEKRATLEALLKNPQALNSYSYVANNPLKFRDESGESIAVLGVLGLAAVGGIVVQYQKDIFQNRSAGLKGIDVYTNLSSSSQYLKSAGEGIAVVGAGLIAGPAAALGTAFITSVVEDAISEKEVTREGVKQGLINFGTAGVGIGMIKSTVNSATQVVQPIVNQGVDTALDLLAQAIKQLQSLLFAYAH